MERYDAMNTVYDEKDFVRDNAEHCIEPEISAAAAIRDNILILGSRRTDEVAWHL
jgi:hypothetical protein